MALSVPFLGDIVGWRRWLAVGFGFAGILVILQPGSSAFGSDAVIPLFAAILMATYGVLNRFAARRDNAMTSFFWTGVAGAVAITLVVPFFWHPPQGSDWWWMALLCITGASGHFRLISALDTTRASRVQRFAYLQLVFASTIGIVIFDDQLDRALTIGSLIIFGSGLFVSEPRTPRQIVSTAPPLAASASRLWCRYRNGHPAILVTPFGYFFDNPRKLQHLAIASFHQHVKLPPSIT